MYALVKQHMSNEQIAKICNVPVHIVNRIENELEAYLNEC